MDGIEKWETPIRSVRKAAKVLKIDLTETDMPKFLNWKAAADMHRNLWSLVYLNRR